MFYTRFHFEKKRFFWLLMAKCFKNKLKSFEKCLKKLKKFFSSESIVMNPRWSRYIHNHPPDPKECFSTPQHDQNYFLKFFKIENSRLKSNFSCYITLLIKRKCKCFDQNIFDFWTKFRKSFWSCRGVEKHSLGSEGCLGMYLDHLGCITINFEEKFFKFFQAFFKAF